ncbi:divalent metal cation transporter [Patescibacteria group bacterium]|nr:divalent metal cation transporter [Patescibacteria group bacterium]
MAKTISRHRSKLAVPIKRRRGIWQYFSLYREGVITGAADNDPSGIATFAQVGATTGFSLIWLLALITPLVVAIEEMSARIGVVTKQGLNRVIKTHYGVRWAIVAGLIVLICNVATIGADIAAMAEIVGVFTNVSWEILVLPLALILAALLTIGSYAAISRYLLVVTLALLVYVAAVFTIRIDTAELINQLWPIRWDGSLMLLVAAVALLGTIISPYLIFWQTTEEAEDKTTIKDLRRERSGVTIGFIYANLIALVIILIAATVFKGDRLIESATQAALMLKPLAGHWAFILFSVGIIFSGLIGIPVLAASTAYTAAEALSLPASLSKSIKQARGFYSILVGSIVISALLVLTHIPPMIMLLYTQVLNGIVTPILLVILLLVANNKKIMRGHTNSWSANLLGIASIVLMLGLDILLLIKWLT